MKYNNYTLSYEKFMAAQFYDEANKEWIVGLDLFLKFDHEFINTRFTDKQLKDFKIIKPESIYVEGIGDSCLFDLVDVIFDIEKKDISLKCHHFLRNKVHIEWYTKYNEIEGFLSSTEISEQEFKRLLFTNYNKVETCCQQTTAYKVNILS